MGFMTITTTWSKPTTVYRAKLNYPAQPKAHYRTVEHSAPLQHHIAGQYFIPVQYNPVLEIHNLLDVAKTGTVSQFLFALSDLIDSSEGGTKTDLETLLKHVIIYHGGNLYRDMVDENDLSDIPYRLWVFFAHCGDWDPVTVPVFRMMPTEVLTRFLMEGELTPSLTSMDILKILSKRDDEFGIPVPLLFNIWLN